MLPSLRRRSPKRNRRISKADLLKSATFEERLPRKGVLATPFPFLGTGSLPSEGWVERSERHHFSGKFSWWSSLRPTYPTSQRLQYQIASSAVGLAGWPALTGFSSSTEVRVFQLVSPFEPAGDQPQAIEALVGGLRAGRTHQVLMGVTGSGKTFTMANVIQAVAAADAGHVAQQDAGRPALQRVQGVLPAQRGPLLRQLLRLLPARGLHPAARHLHRERRLDQPGDRPPAAGGHQRPGQPPRRDHRGQRLLHLRPGLAGGLPRDDGRPARWAGGRPRRDARASWSTSSTSGTTSSFEPGKFRVRGDCVEVWPVLRGVRLPHRVLGRRGRAALDHQSHQRRGDRAAGGAVHLPGQALRPARGADRRRPSTRSSEELERAAGAVHASRASCWRPSGSAPARGSTSR